MSWRTFAFLLLSVSIIATALVGCAKKSDVVLIGDFGPFQGPVAEFGTATHKGIALAIDEVNARGGLLDKKVVLKSEDDRGEASEARTAAEKLITRDGAIALLGEVVSNNTRTAAPVAQNNKVPIISPASTNPDVTKAGDYIFRVCFTDDFQGAACAVFASDQMKAKRAAIFRDVTTDYSKGLASAFRATFEKKGGKVVFDSTYTPNDSDYKSQLTSLKPLKPDVIFIPGYYTQVSLIAVQARQLGIAAPLLGGDGWDSPLLVTNSAGALEGCYFTNHFTALDKNPAVQSFARAYRAKYKAEPNSWAALGYDAAWILAEAVKKAGKTDGDSIRRAIAETRDYPGVTGRISIDGNRNARKPAIVVQVKGSKFVPVASITPEQVK